MAREFQNILDDSLDLALNRGESIDACLKKYPEAAAELKPLLKLALQGRAALAAEAPAGAMAAGREKVIARAASLSGLGRPATAGMPLAAARRFLLKPAAIAAAIIVLLFAGTAAASTAAGPDSILYPLKQRVEDARRLVAAQDLDQAKVEVGRAEKRLDETLSIIDKEKPEYVPGLMSRFDTHLESAASLAVEAADKGDDAGEVEAMIEAARERRRQVLGEIEDLLPDDVRDRVRQEEPGGSGGEAPSPGQTPAPQPAGSRNYNEPSGPEDYARGGGDGYEHGGSPGSELSNEPPESPYYEPPEKENGSESSGDDEHLSDRVAPHTGMPADEAD